MNDQEVIDLALSILEARIQTPDSFLTSPQDAAHYLILKLAECEREVFAVLFLNNQHGLIEYAELFYGTIDGASVHPREVVKAALKANAAAIVIAHNHPSGLAEPSEADQRITGRLISALGLVDIRVLDHIIVANTSTYSFAENGLL